MLRFLFIFLGFFALACADDATEVPMPDAAPQPIVDAEVDAEIDAEPIVDAEPMIDAAPIIDAAPPPPGRELYLDAPRDVLVRFGERVPLPVRLVTLDGAPIPDTDVFGQLLDNANQEQAIINGTALVSQRARTDAEGRASIDIQGGQEDASFQVSISSEGAAAVFYRVTVAAGTEGTITVSVTLEEGLDSDPTSLKVYASPACDQLLAGTALPEITTLDPLQDPADFNARSTSGPLAAGSVVSVLAEMRREEALTGRGCVDGIEVIASQDTDVTVPITAMTLGYEGVFPTEEVYDMAVLVPGGQSEILTSVAEIGGASAGSRGQAIVDLVCTYAELSAMTCTAINLAAGVIDTVIESSVPPYVLEALTVFGDLYNIIRSMQVGGDITIAVNVPVEGVLAGNTHRLLTMQFTWREGCPHDTPEECTFTIEMDDAGLGLNEIPAASFEGVILEDGRLQIGQHVLALPMEHVALLLVESWLLPSHSGEPMSVEQLIAQLLPCEDIVSMIPFGLGVDTCEEYLAGALAGLILEQVNGLAAGISQVTLEGIATPRDADHDRRVEGLVEGAWTGSMPGTFTACRADATCR